MDDTEQVKEQVWKKLATLCLAELTEIVQGLQLKVAETKVGKRSAVYGAIVKHLMSDEVEDREDDGKELFDLVNTILDQLLSRQVKVEATANQVSGEFSGGVQNGGVQNGSNETGDAGTQVSSAASEAVNAPVSSPVTQMANASVTLATQMLEQMGTSLGGSVMTTASQNVIPGRTEIIPKLREFKIIGGTVGTGDGQLDYTSLSYQIQEGKASGYSAKQIMGGVVRAMKAGSSLRKYFESRPTMSEINFFQILRSHYNVKDSATLLTELSGISGVLFGLTLVLLAKLSEATKV